MGNDTNTASHAALSGITADWQRGSLRQLMSEISARGFGDTHCAWTWDPRPALKKTQRLPAWGAGAFPGFDVQRDTANGDTVAFLEAHVFWAAPDDVVVQLAIVAQRQDQLRWVWEHHRAVSTWAVVPSDLEAAEFKVRIDGSGALVLQPSAE